MPSLLSMKTLQQIPLFANVVTLITSLISLLTFADFAVSAAFPTFLCKMQSFWSEPILSVDGGILLDELGDDLIGHGGHRGVLVHRELQEDFPLVVPWDRTKELDNVFLLTHLGYCLCIGIDVGCVSVSGRWPCVEIVILDFPIDPRSIIVNISAVL